MMERVICDKCGKNEPAKFRHSPADWQTYSLPSAPPDEPWHRVYVLLCLTCQGALRDWITSAA